MDTVAQGWGEFERVNQTGKQTGNDEEENYIDTQCQVRGTSMFLVLSNEHGQWLSGKIRSRRNLVEYAPQGGTLEVVRRPGAQPTVPRRTEESVRAHHVARCLAPGTGVMVQ